MTELSSIQTTEDFKRLAQEAIAEWKSEKHKNLPPETLKVVSLVRNITCNMIGSILLSRMCPDLVYKMIKYTIRADGGPKDAEFTTKLLLSLHLAKLELLNQSASLQFEESKFKKVREGKSCSPVGFPELFGKGQKNAVSLIDPQGRKVIVDKIAFSLLFPDYMKRLRFFPGDKKTEIHLPFLSKLSLEDLQLLTEIGMFNPTLSKVLEAVELGDMLAPSDSQNYVTKTFTQNLTNAFASNCPEASEETRTSNILDSDSRWVIQTILYLGVEASDEVEKEQWKSVIKGEKKTWDQEINRFYTEHPNESYERDRTLGHALSNVLLTEEFHKNWAEHLKEVPRVTFSSFKRLTQENSLAGISFRAISQATLLRLVLRAEGDLVELKEILLKDPSLAQRIESIIDMSGTLTPQDLLKFHSPREERSCSACLHRYRVRMEGQTVTFIGNHEDVQEFERRNKLFESDALKEYLNPKNTKTWADLRPEHERIVTLAMNAVRNPWF